MIKIITIKVKSIKNEETLILIIMAIKIKNKNNDNNLQS